MIIIYYAKGSKLARLLFDYDVIATTGYDRRSCSVVQLCWSDYKVEQELDRVNIWMKIRLSRSVVDSRARRVSSTFWKLSSLQVYQRFAVVVDVDTLAKLLFPCTTWSVSCCTCSNFILKHQLVDMDVRCIAAFSRRYLPNITILRVYKDVGLL